MGFLLSWGKLQLRAVGFANGTSALEQEPWPPDWSNTAMILLWFVTSFAVVASLCIIVDRVRRSRPDQARSEIQPKLHASSHKIYPEERISDMSLSHVTH